MTGNYISQSQLEMTGNYISQSQRGVGGSLLSKPLLSFYSRAKAFCLNQNNVVTFVS